jgi:chromosomal replication initiation ATPase DnaA
MPPTPIRDLVRAIITAVAERYGITPEAIVEKRPGLKAPKYAIARHVAIWLVRYHTGLSYPEIGRRFFSGRDHTTILYGCRRCAADKHLLAVAAEIWAEIGGDDA